MQILMTGGTGLIGQHFIRTFQQYRYTVLSRQAASMPMDPSQRCTYISDLSHLRNLNTFDYVINLAGEPIADKRWSDAQKLRICDSRWHITQQLVELFDKSSKPPKVFLSGSAIGFYGDTGTKKTDELAGFVPDDFASSLCHKWETIAEGASMKTRVVILRTGVVLSAEGGALKKMLLPFKLGLGGKMGSGQQMMSWIHIDDMVRAMQFLLEQDITGAVNLTAPNPVNNDTFTKAMGKVLHRPTIFSVPAVMLKLLMGESSSLLLGSQNIVPARLLNAGFSFQHPQLASALQNLL
ncbi:TIGR01777 family oxidoreductase [Neptunicella marina]|uniref:TIGR01777 family protein n=1 Tax=Neptunicella marina TaxID=2125989 RepID=A0A8J6IUK6_9ALTE|nr:TIGR01777 family oxidoreductase [Neptunicella marina]MBC3766062.1 TIGR01777 family protein [Neptunicella marina]